MSSEQILLPLYLRKQVKAWEDDTRMMSERIRELMSMRGGGENINRSFFCVFRLNGFYFLGIRGTEVQGWAEKRLARLRRKYSRSKPSRTYEGGEGRGEEEEQTPIAPLRISIPSHSSQTKRKINTVFPAPISSLMVLQKASGQASWGPIQGERENQGWKGNGGKKHAWNVVQKLLPGQQAHGSQSELIERWKV